MAKRLPTNLHNSIYRQEPRVNGLDAGRGGTSNCHRRGMSLAAPFTRYFIRVTREQFIMAATMIGRLITNLSRSEVTCGKIRRYAYATALGSLVVLQSSMVNLKGNRSQIKISSLDFWKMPFQIWKISQIHWKPDIPLQFF